MKRQEENVYTIMKSFSTPTKLLLAFAACSLPKSMQVNAKTSQPRYDDLDIGGPAIS